MVGITAPAFGGHRVHQLIGVGATGSVYQADDLTTHRRVAIKTLRTELPPEVSVWIAEKLGDLIDQLPAHPAAAELWETGVQNQEPYFVSDYAAGEPLDRVLEHFGPGAIGDVLPRLRAIADALDQAAAHGIRHGALHPPDVIVSPDLTVVTGIGIAEILDEAGVTVPNRAPYVAPELTAGEFPSNASDQFSLAAIAFEWLFGEPISGPAMAPIDVPDLPGVNGEALSAVFTTALAPTASERFASCHAFVDGLSACVSAVAEQTLRVGVQRNDWPIEPAPSRVVQVRLAGVTVTLRYTPKLPGTRLAAIRAPESVRRLGRSLLATMRVERSRSIGLAFATALSIAIAWAVVGLVTTSRVRPVAKPSSALPVLVDRLAITEPVRSAIPSSLMVTAQADGPPPQKAATDVPFTDRMPAKRVTTHARAPARRDNERRRPTAKAPLSPSPEPSRRGNGSLLIESRPSGATVAVNGMARGKTPLRIGAIPAGDYEVRLTLPNFQPESVTVHVTAGEHARVGPSMTPLEPRN